MLKPAFKSRSFRLQVHSINCQNLVYLSILEDGWTFKAVLGIWFK